MRAPFQILAIPFKKMDEKVLFAVFCRSDDGSRQFIAGGGEDKETPEQAAKREIFEEAGIHTEILIKLTSTAYLPADIISEKFRSHWKPDIYVLPEYSFAFECKDGIFLSDEHTSIEWLEYKDALNSLRYDSNKTALYELNCRLNDRLQ